MSLDEFREAAVLGEVVERVGNAKTFCGETLLQKSAYFLKELLNVPLSTNFKIYYYGPYSFDLRERLTWMEAMEFVRTEPHEWGATYKAGRRLAQLKKRFPFTLKKYSSEIDWVVKELARLSVKQLEPLATALFLTRESPRSSRDQRAQKLHDIKPHVNLETAKAALEYVDHWLSERDRRLRHAQRK